MQRLLSLTLAAFLSLSAPALAKGKPDKVGMPKKLIQLDEHGKADKGKAGKGKVDSVHGKADSGKGKKAKGSDAAHGVFDQDVRERVRGYYASEQRSGHCPPGLAKKNNGCLPPGQAKKHYAVGEAVPADLRVDELPRRLLNQLPPPPDDSYYGVVEGSVVRIGRATGKILEAVDILSGF